MPIPITPEIRTMMDHAVINALTLAREMPAGWLDNHSMLHREFERLQSLALLLAEIEGEHGDANGTSFWAERPGTSFWAERPGMSDFESACAVLCRMVDEAPYQPITKERILDLLDPSIRHPNRRPRN